MHWLRTTARLLALALAWVASVVLAGCGGMAPSGFGGNTELLLTRAQAFARTLAKRPPQELSDEEVLALGYLERVRLGLGSPFRLVEFALHDPDLSDGMRERLAYALLAEALHGRSYQMDAGVLESVPLFAVPPHVGVGPPQLELIERTVAGAPTASSGERAVRLGYLLAEAERTVGGDPHSVVAHVAALVADRRRAREDAAALLRSAATRREDPLEVVRRWRRELRFQVERPALAPLSVREEEAEAREGVNTAQALRTLAQRLSAPISLVDARPSEDGSEEERSWLSPGVTARLQALAERRDFPAQAPIAVAVAINRDAFVTRPDLSPEERGQRVQFADSAWNEERLVAGMRRLQLSGAGRGVRLELIGLQAATFLRVWNQEEPWYPGDPAPAAKDLEARFGLAGISVSDRVPPAWRPYYLRMLGRGLADLQRVLPTASTRGLRIRVGALPRDVRALALHEPRTRTLHLPPETGSGTLAHEIAHDLDWQLARKRYGVRGYATDLAVRRGRGDRIAASLAGLAAALTRPGADTLSNPHDTRPAEIFARGADWLVAAAMAREGRTGGYLTSFQDAGLTGYGTTRGPDVSGGAVPALLTILDGVAPVEREFRDWATEAYGPARSPSPTELAREVVRAGAGAPLEARLTAVARTRDRSLGALNAASCRLSSAEGMRRLVAAQRKVVHASVGAAARGAAVDAARALAVEQLGRDAARAVDGWLAWRLYGAPEPVDSALHALAPSVEDLLLRAGMLEAVPEVEVASAFHPPGATPICGGNPFAAVIGRQSPRLFPGRPRLPHPEGRGSGGERELPLREEKPMNYGGSP